MLIPCDEVNILNTFRVMIILRLLLLLTNLHLKLLSTQGTGADKLLSTQELKLYSIVTHFINFKHNFHKEIETFYQNKSKWIQEICFKMNLLSSELPFHVHNWLFISLKDFCIVIRKWPTFWPSSLA